MHSTRFQRLHQRFGAALTPSRIAFLAVLLYLISLIPIFLFSSYCHPLADDFTYGLLVHRAVVSGGGIPEILSAAAETVRDYYFTWQGTFSAIFLFALQPGAFSESAYFLTPFIMIGCLSLSTFVLMHFVYCRLLGGKSSQAVILSALTLLLSVQMVTNQAQAFYWFNGASYYAVFYSFSLLFFAGIGTLLLDAGKKMHPVLTGCCALLAVLIGGGNYSTALTTSFIASVLCAAWLFFKKPGRFRLAVILLILLVSFAISVLAPGNAVRAAREASIPPVLAILLSLSNAVIWVMSWVNLPQIVLFTIAGVFFYCLPDRRILPFRHPVLASILIFGLYASQYTPPLYAMGYIGSGRQINIYCYSSYWCIFAILYYWINWFKHTRSEPSGLPVFLAAPSHRAAFFLAGILMLAVGLVGPEEPLPSLQRLTSGRAITAIVDGSADRHEQAYQERLELLLTPSDVCVLPGLLPPCPPFEDDLLAASEDDGEYWQNEALAEYFNHEKVVLDAAG